MPRSARDATRFTATGPFAHSKDTPSKASQITIGAPPPPGETPQQKVARLREAARRARLREEGGTTFDRVVARGRVWADRAHFVTTYTLIGLTAIGFVVGSYALVDMMLYNRRRRKEWYAEQQERHLKLLATAYEANRAGRADEDQMLLINQERARQEAELEKQNKKGMFGKMKETLWGGLSLEEQKGGKLGLAAQKAGNTLHEEVVKPVTGQESGKGLGIVKAVEEKRRPVEKTIPISKGGMLDQLGENTATAMSDKTKSWTSWITRR
ncbi:hypothetical protein K402DRAFT_354120 [Aulographum hederae CBS 113979]|uniref:Cytochrome oxidase c assembly-domain-containing protein n=1 Tax=Aulographum hederae CBS 113979 TaxID=1176131 RepID=A0A6G1H266_9PEZI|nr:hypothetical protein K402DRAFT_354120 [Aulographum hederae CBS 113979]